MVAAVDVEMGCGLQDAAISDTLMSCNTLLPVLSEPSERHVEPVTFSTPFECISALEFPSSFPAEEIDYDNLKTTNALLHYTEEFPGRFGYDRSDWLEKDIAIAKDLLSGRPCSSALQTLYTRWGEFKREPRSLACLVGTLFNNVFDNDLIDVFSDDGSDDGSGDGDSWPDLSSYPQPRGSYSKKSGRLGTVTPYFDNSVGHYIIGEVQPTSTLTLEVMRWMLWYCQRGYRPLPVLNDELGVDESVALHLLNECWLQQLTNTGVRSFVTNGQIWLFFKVDGNDRSAMIASRIYHRDGRVDPYAAMMPPDANMLMQPFGQRRAPPLILLAMALSGNLLAKAGSVPDRCATYDPSKPLITVRRTITMPRSLALLGRHCMVPQLFTEPLRRVKVSPATIKSGTWHKQWYRRQHKSLNGDEDLPTSYPCDDRIELEQHLGNGHLGDVFSGTLTCDGVETNCAFKIVHSGTFDEATWHYDYIIPYSGRRALLTVLEEASFMALLGPDGITPRLHEAWLSKDCLGRDFAVVAMERLGEAATRSLPEADKRAIVRTFEKLHAYGFEYAYVKLEHICRRTGSEDAPFAVVDQESLRLVDSSDSADDQIAEVRYLLSLKII